MAATTRTAGRILLVGAVLNIIGSVLNNAGGSALFRVLETGNDADLAQQLTAVASEPILLFGLVVWCLGMPTLSLGLALLASAGRWGGIARYAAIAGGAFAMTSVALMFVIVNTLAPAHADGQDVLDRARSTADVAHVANWLGAVLHLAVAPGAVLWSTRTDWAPAWLVAVIPAAGIAAVVTLLGLLFQFHAILIGVVLVGLPFVAATGVAAARSSDSLK